MSIKTIFTGTGLSLLALTCAIFSPPNWAASNTVEVQMQEWPVPWKQSRPRDPSVAADGSIWFVGQGDDYLGHFSPQTEKFDRIDLPKGTGPHNVIVGPEQNLWVAGNRNARIIKVTPDNHKMTTFKLPGNEGDPHTQQFAPDGSLWFTMQSHNSIGQLQPDSGEFQVIPVPTKRARPYGMEISEGGALWFTKFGSNKLAHLNRNTGEIREFELNRKEARPRRLAIADDGGIWYVDYAQGFLGRLDPETGKQREWAAPSGNSSLPYGMAMDKKGRIWFVETGPNPNRLVGFDPQTEEYVAQESIESGGGSVRHMVYDEARNSLWFGTDTNTLGEARIDSAP